MPGAAMNAARISRPNSVLMGMFCRFGLVDERRPVAVPTWLKVVCTRPSRIGQQWQRVDVVGLELGQLPVLQHLARNLVMLRQLFEHIHGRGDYLAASVLDGLGQVHFVEQHVAQLLGRIDVEAMAGARKDLLAHPLHLYGQPLAHVGEHGTVDAHARLFHAQQDGNQRQVDVAIDLARTERFHVAL